MIAHPIFQGDPDAMPRVALDVKRGPALGVSSVLAGVARFTHRQVMDLHLADIAKHIDLLGGHIQAIISLSGS